MTATTTEQAAAENRAPLSFNQEFLCLFDQGDDAGPFGLRYHLVNGWRLRGRLDVGTLEVALEELVERHESLRTTIVRDENGPYLDVGAPCSPELTVVDMGDVEPANRDRKTHELINEVERGTFDVTTLPLIRAVLYRFDDDDSVLVLMVHHTGGDGWSMRVIIRDLAEIYAARKQGVAAELPPVTQYRTFALRQRAAAQDEPAMESARFWHEKLDGARIFTMPVDHPRSAQLAPVTAVHRFAIGPELTSSVLRVARSQRSSPFMVMLGAFDVMLHRRTGNTDLVVPTFSPGRGLGQVDDTVGSFFNFLPIRADLTGCTTVGDVLSRVRRSCVEAYTHDIPAMKIFEQAPELMAPALAEDRAPWVFQAFPMPFMLDDSQVGDLRYTEARRRLVSQSVGSDVPDGALWTLNIDPAGDVIASVQFRVNVFAEDTIVASVAEYQQVLSEVVRDLDAPL